MYVCVYFRGRKSICVAYNLAFKKYLKRSSKNSLPNVVILDFSSKEAVLKDDIYIYFFIKRQTVNSLPVQLLKIFMVDSNVF